MEFFIFQPLKILKNMTQKFIRQLWSHKMPLMPFQCFLTPTLFSFQNRFDSHRISWINRILKPFCSLSSIFFMFANDNVLLAIFWSFPWWKKKKIKEKFQCRKRKKKVFMSFYWWSEKKEKKMLLLNITQHNTSWTWIPTFSSTKKGSINLLFCVIAIIGRRERERERKKLKKLFLLRTFSLFSFYCSKDKLLDAIFQLLRGKSFLIDFLGFFNSEIAHEILIMSFLINFLLVTLILRFLVLLTRAEDECFKPHFISMNFKLLFITNNTLQYFINFLLVFLHKIH